MGAPLALPRAAIGELPEGWSLDEVVDDVYRMGSLPVHRAGAAAMRADGVVATGSGASTVESPILRAYAELVERASLLDHVTNPRAMYVERDVSGGIVGEVEGRAVFPRSADPARWRYAKSNGVALGRTWIEACTAAARELVERDRVLRSWFGEVEPVRVEVSDDLLPATGVHDWEVYRLASATAPWRATEVVVALGFPRQADVPLARGFGAALTVREACSRALAEALQTAAFLGEEDVPAERPSLAPTSAFHLDFYTWPGAHPLLRRWLDGEHLCSGGGSRAVGTTLTFVDLTPQGQEQKFRVVRARCPAALPLIFGEGPAPAQTGLLPDARVHPIA